MTKKNWIEDVEFLNFLKDLFDDPFHGSLLPCEIKMLNGDKYYGKFILKDLLEIENDKSGMIDVNNHLKRFSYKLNYDNIVSIKYDDCLYKDLLIIDDLFYSDFISDYYSKNHSFENLKDEEVIYIFMKYYNIYKKIHECEKNLCSDNEFCTVFGLSRNGMCNLVYKKRFSEIFEK